MKKLLGLKSHGIYVVFQMLYTLNIYCNHTLCTFKFTERECIRLAEIDPVCLASNYMVKTKHRCLKKYVLRCKTAVKKTSLITDVYCFCLQLSDTAFRQCLLLSTKHCLPTEWLKCKSPNLTPI